VHAVAAARSRERVVALSGGADGTVRAWDVATGAAVGRPMAGPACAIVAVAAGPGAGGELLAVAGDQEGMVRTWTSPAAPLAPRTRRTGAG